MTADEFRALIARKEAVQAPFCALWVELGARKATAAELLYMAEQVELPINGKSGKARLISFSRWLGSLAGSSIKGAGVIYRIAPARKLNGYTRWTISAEPASESEVKQKFQW
jgi:hypothetical protein